jgi:hypothetical protein
MLVKIPLKNTLHSLQKKTKRNHRFATPTVVCKLHDLFLKKTKKNSSFKQQTVQAVQGRFYYSCFFVFLYILMGF